MAIFAVGGMFGSIGASWASQKFGLKRSMALNNILVFLAALLMGFCKLAGSFEMLILGKFYLLWSRSGLNKILRF